MKRAQFSIFRSGLLLTLVSLFLYSASVQEIHYLFVSHNHEVSEHCHNHLHTQTGHADCSLCKIELSSFVKNFHQFDLNEQLVSISQQIHPLLDASTAFNPSSSSPRGPPALA